jgi:hypothetical protein
LRIELLLGEVNCSRCSGSWYSCIRVAGRVEISLIKA